MVDLADFDKIAEQIEAGHWVGDIPGLGDLRLKVRSFHSEAYRKAIRRLAAEDLDDDDAEVEALVDAILLDWENLTMEPGGPAIDHSAETARELLADATMPRFRAGVVWAAEGV